VLDLPVLARELGVPVVPTVAVHKRGLAELVAEVEKTAIASAQQG
jgi:ferrous iron transport protein B